MGTLFLISTVQLAKNIVIAPNTVFEETRDGGLAREVMAIFGVALLITLGKASFKSFTEPPQTANFFVSESLNEVLSFLGHPLLGMIFFYLVYCVFLLGVSGMCRIFKKGVRAKPLVISLMAISAIGVIMQVVFYPLSFLLPRPLLLLGEYLVYGWVLVLSILAIRAAQRLSPWRAVVCFLVPFSFLLLGAVQLGVAPYIAYLKS